MLVLGHDDHYRLDEIERQRNEQKDVVEERYRMLVEVQLRQLFVCDDHPEEGHNGQDPLLTVMDGQPDLSIALAAHGDEEHYDGYDGSQKNKQASEDSLVGSVAISTDDEVALVADLLNATYDLKVITFFFTKWDIESILRNSMVLLLCVKENAYFLIIFIF